MGIASLEAGQKEEVELVVFWGSLLSGLLDEGNKLVLAHIGGAATKEVLFLKEERLFHCKSPAFIISTSTHTN